MVDSYKKKQPDRGGASNRERRISISYSLKLLIAKPTSIALRKAKDYIRYSQGKIIYVIVVSVYHFKYIINPNSMEVDSEELSSATESGESASAFTLSSLEGAKPNSTKRAR